MASVNLSKYKSSNFDAAKRMAVVSGPDLLLVPIGPWILDEPDLIASMAAWRQASMNMFFARFDSTPAKTRNYLESASIGQANRLLFVILEDDTVVGHIGISNSSESSAELDNVMRGVRSDNRQMMQQATETLAEWVKTELGLRQLTLKVSSLNERAIVLYERCGFSLTSSSALKRTESEDLVQLVECADADATVAERCNTMTLEILTRASS